MTPHVKQVVQNSAEGTARALDLFSSYLKEALTCQMKQVISTVIMLVFVGYRFRDLSNLTYYVVVPVFSL